MHASLGNPEISKMIWPGLITAAQYFGSPFPLPIRVSKGIEVTDFEGKTRMNKRPSPRMNRAHATRPASMFAALNQAGSSAWIPHSPKLTRLAR
jgi:hypothetical protein